jgi:hypothetical protein
MKFEATSPALRRNVRHQQLRETIPLADSTIYERPADDRRSARASQSVLIRTGSFLD